MQLEWVVIALHNSTQAFMVLALQGTAPLNVIKEPEKSFEAIQHGKEYPKEFLLTFLKLYKDIKSKNRMTPNINSKCFSCSKEIDEAIERLNDFRNKFIHFIPSSWSLEITWIPEICKQVLLVIEFLILESGNTRFYDDDESEKANLTELISRIRIELENLEMNDTSHR